MHQLSRFGLTQARSTELSRRQFVETLGIATATTILGSTARGEAAGDFAFSALVRRPNSNEGAYHVALVRRNALP